jgi:hypothetical protein
VYSGPGFPQSGPHLKTASNCSPLKSGFGQVDVVLNQPQSFVANGLLVA